MKLITSQGTIQLEEGGIVTITTDEDYPMVEFEVVEPFIQIAIYDPQHVKSEVLI